MAYRLPSKTVPPIIARFISHQTREMWISAAKGKRLVTSQLSLHLGDTPVYMNCHFTGHNKYLLGLPKGMLREKKLVAAWILVRKTEGSKACRASGKEDLERLVKLA